MAKKTAEEKLEAGISLIRDAFAESKEAAKADLLSILTGAARSGGKPAKAATPATGAKKTRKSGWPKKGTLAYKQRMNKTWYSREKALRFPEAKPPLPDMSKLPKGWKTPEKPVAKRATNKTAVKKTTKKSAARKTADKK